MKPSKDWYLAQKIRRERIMKRRLLKRAAVTDAVVKERKKKWPELYTRKKKAKIANPALDDEALFFSLLLGQPIASHVRTKDIFNSRN